VPTGNRHKKRVKNGKSLPDTCRSWKNVEEVSRMKSTGMVRKMDPMGRVVLPIELRNTLNIKTDDALEIFIDGTVIFSKKWPRL
jgi:hypothetical protein